MGKMIDAQSICVATAATHQIGKEADIFKAVVWHCIILAAIVGLITLLQAYVLSVHADGADASADGGAVICVG